MNDNRSTESQEIVQRLKNAETLYVLISGCIEEPYVACDPELLDGKTYMPLMPEDAQAKTGELVGSNIDIKVAKLEDRQMLMFYISLYTMRVNALAVAEGVEKRRIQLADFVRRDRPTQDPEGKMWMENPELHPTALYYMQELRKQPAQKNSPQLRGQQEEISNYSAKDSFIAPMQKEGNDIPVIKLNNQEMYQVIFTGIMESQKFNRENRLHPFVVTADKISQILVVEAVGVLLNPMKVRMLLQIKKQTE